MNVKSVMMRAVISKGLPCAAVMFCAEVALSQALPCPPSELQRLMPPCEPGIFGQAVALSEGRMAVGEFEPLGGLVTTFNLKMMPGAWQQEAELRPDDLTPSDGFGYSVAFDHSVENGNWLLAAGSPQKRDIAYDAGKAYVFLFDGGQWVQHSSVLPDQPMENEWFGRRVCWARDGSRTFLIVAAPGSIGAGLSGSVYIFEQDQQGVWRQQARLQAPQPHAEDGYGNSIAATEVGGTTILAVGAPFYGLAREMFPGAVYAYRFDATHNEWPLETVFAADEPAIRDQFGYDVDIQMSDLQNANFRLAIGSQGENGGGAYEGPGGAYLFARDADGNWSEETRIPPPVDADDLLFGHSVYLDRERSDRLLVSAVNSHEFGRESGAAYVYQRNPANGNWIVTQALIGHEQDSYDAFAVDLALGDGPSADMAVVGALATQCPGGTQFDAVGAVYSFDLNPGNGGACPAPVIRLQKVPDCSSGTGGPLEVRWFQATPDQRARVAILFGKRTGHFAIPNGNPCAGTELGLSAQALQVAFVRSAGQFGAGRLTTTIPRSACGGYLQLLDITRCELSNVVRIE